MLLKMDMRQKLVSRILRLVSTQTATASTPEDVKSSQHDLYESIALGNALADIEDEANRAWRGR